MPIPRERLRLSRQTALQLRREFPKVDTMIADSLPGVSVSVSIDNRPLREYAADTEVRGDQNASNTTTAFIEATPEATNGVRTSLTDITTGGFRRKSKFAPLATTDARPSANAKDSVSHGDPSRQTQKHLVPKKVPEKALKGRAISCRAGSGDAVPVPVANISRPGTKVEYSWGEQPICTYRFLYRTHPAAKGVPEKALKGRAVTHHAKLGKAKPTTNHWVNATYPYGEAPVAVYIFEYRTHRGLVAEGIIERTPSPVPLEEPDAASFTQAELMEEVVRLRAEKVAAVKIKKEGDRKKAKVAESESVDLCDSDEEED
ncbi:hypothetical protein B0A48_01858 [Cryoendolithus antarcticus]|uniref:DUF7918 domain-containing protein n=1 Tax=Cryoendolithus antarcticus TaxID=1507870 RepID=A0A1V8TQH1_9PEZI|nr:hypothetical protein B0A48_01858 [Cryoendolithus antarcticus]